MKKILILLLQAHLLTFSALAQDTAAIRFSKNIDSLSIKKNLIKLASAEFEGRETGKPGQKLAAKYIADFFRSAGIPPLKDSTYLQEFPLKLVYPEGVSISINGKKYEQMKDFFYLPGFNDTIMEIKEVLFLGFGIDDDKYSDYKGNDIKGKTVLILGLEPKNKKGLSYITGNEKMSAWTNNWRKKYNQAKDHKPAAILQVVDSIQKSIGAFKNFISNPSLKAEGSKDDNAGIPTFYISAEMADAILAASNTKSEKVKKGIEKKGESKTFLCTVPVKIEARRKSERITSENVLGFVEGSDLKNEVVVVTAHYDHLGKKDTIIYYGADDDGSGTATIMELAKVFALAKKEGKGPRRSILFMAVSGEEKGLLGSSYYTDNPVFPLANTVADLNIDMIGRLDEKHKGNPDYVYIIGSDKLSTDLHALSEKTNATYTKLELDYTYNDPKDPNRFYYRSDHYNFAKNNIPIIFYFTGVHEDYHRPTDTADKIDFKKIQKIAQLVFFTAWELANRNERIVVDKKNDFKNER